MTQDDGRDIDFIGGRVKDRTPIDPPGPGAEAHRLHLFLVFRHTDVFKAVGHKLVGKNRHGRPETLGQIKGLDRHCHGLLSGIRRQDDGFKVSSLRGVTGQIEFALTGGAGDSAYRAHTPRVEYHHGDFAADGPSVRVCIEDITGAGRGGHGFHAAPGGP